MLDGPRVKPSHDICMLQVVHHLFPNICHTHYPAIAPIVVETCREFGVPYKVFPSVRSCPVLRTHYCHHCIVSCCLPPLMMPMENLQPAVQMFLAGEHMPGLASQLALPSRPCCRVGTSVGKA